MNSIVKSIKDHPKQNANILSKLLFIWTFKLFYDGTKRNLEIADLHEVRDNNKSDVLGNRLERYWNLELYKHKKHPKYKPSLLKALVKTFYMFFLSQHILMFIGSCFFRILSPYLLGKLIRCFNKTEKQSLTEETYWLAGLLSLNIVILALLENHTMKARLLLGMKIRIALCTLMYRKILKLNLSAFAETSYGQVTNLLSNDVSRFDLLFLATHYFTILPFQVAVTTYLMWVDFQFATLAGIAMLAIQCLPLQGYFGKIVANLRSKIADLTDTRIIIMNEIISGIQVIKMYAWEKPFEAFVKHARIKELKIIRQSSFVKGFNMASMVFTERTTLFVSVIVYGFLGHYCVPDKVFAMAQYFNILQATLAIYYPLAVISTAEALVSVRRIQKFLLLQEKENIDNSNEEIIHPNVQTGEIIIKNLTTSWVKGHQVLKNISMHVKCGEFCAIIGPVGSGKSSLLNTILSEMYIDDGCIQSNGTISYSSQEPWLFAGSVRKNILFGLPYNRDKYKEVTRACSLSKDFEQLPHGDHTLIGDKGASLSGGQKARINLARAIYRDCDIYLLDDPLSAVDTYVGKQLFHEVAEKYLRNKTRILVTHQIQHLENVDRIIVLRNGKIEVEGTYNEIMSKNIEILSPVEDKKTEVEEARKSKLLQQNTQLAEKRYSVTTLFDESIPTVEEEGIESGKLSWNVYYEYLKASGNVCQIMIFFAVLVLTQVICNLVDIWLAYLTNIDQELANKEEQPVIYNLNGTMEHYNETYNTYDHIQSNSHWTEDLRIIIYSGLIVATIISTIIRSIYFFWMCMNASVNLHNKIFHALLKTPMCFFNKNSIGRIMNRFSKDVGCVDELLPRCMVETFQIFSVMIGILCIVCIVSYYMIIPTIILLILFLIIRTIYLDTAQDMKRLEGVTRSPVFSLASSTLQGLVTIRSCKAENSLQIEFDQLQDTHTSAWYWTVVCGVVLGLYVDFLCTIFFAIVSFSFIFMDQNSVFTSSNVGLALSQAMILTGMMQVGIKQSVEMVCQMTSVERMLQYTKLKEEGPFETSKDVHLPKNWPSEGQIKFLNVSLKYDEDEPFVLKNLYLDINSGEKIGIVGRTGAGKSTLISSLFHLSCIEGSIMIDGIDINNIGLSDLRSHISIIPQEPVLFSATMRFNLDPFNQYDDDTLWKTLEDVELKESVLSLDFQIQSGGTNFSIGQRQLICLARAILKRNKILVLDEATANVDQQTDEIIQKTIRQKFATCTVLTIAHRLNTIMDSNKVLVMDAGRMVQYDHPYKLLQDTEGIFYKLVNETGPTMTEHLQEIARKSYLNQITYED